MTRHEANMQPFRAWIGWSRGSGIVSRLIKRLDKSYFSHVYYRFDFEPTGSLIYESHLSGGVQVTPYHHMQEAIVSGKVEKVHEIDLNLGASGSSLLWESCEQVHGKAYDARQILLYYIWIRACRRRKRAGDRLMTLNRADKYTCNEFVISRGIYIVPQFGAVDYTYTPESLFNVFMGRPSLTVFG